MILEAEKDWFENYSKAGKISMKYNKLLSNVISNLKANTRKRKVKSCLEISAFESLENKEKNNNINNAFFDDGIDIFKKSEENENNNNNNNNKNSNIIYNNKKILSIKDRQKYKYHDEHMNNIKNDSISKSKIKEENIIPSCTKYNPNYNSILKVPKSIPSWEKQSGRKLQKKPNSCDKFYLEHNDIIDTMAGTAFIDMSKQPLKLNSGFQDLNNNNLENKLDSLIGNFEYNKINYYNNNDSQRSYTVLTKEITKPSSRVSSQPNRNGKIIKNKHFKKYNNNKNIGNSRAISASLMNKKIMKRISEGKNNNNEISKDIMNISDNSNIKEDNIDDCKNDNIISNYDINNSINIKKYFNNFNQANNSRKIKNQNLNNLNNSDQSSNSQEFFDSYYIQRMKKIKSKNKNNSNQAKRKNYSMSLLKNKIKAPDFKKSLSREDLESIKNGHITFIPYIVPNDKYIRERPIMMVSYNLNKNKHKINKTKSSHLKGINYTCYFDANKALENINNHTRINAPNFNLMSSRPIDDDPLPSYMKKIVGKNLDNGVSEFSLNMNNYKNRGFSSLKSSFFPKQSYNKIINMSLLKSKIYLENIFGEYEKKLKRKNKMLDKVVRICKQNYKHLIKERELNKFDHVTMKGNENEKIKKIYKII